MGDDLLPGSAGSELLARLKDLMTRGGLFSGVNLLFRVRGGRVDVDMMASSSDSLGVLLATIRPSWMIRGACHAGYRPGTGRTRLVRGGTDWAYAGT
jgi:hypothetical protein